MRVITLSILISCSIHIAHSRARASDAIRFPDEVHMDPCEGLTYCTVKPKDYPQEKFNLIFQSYTVLHQPSPLMEFPNRVGGADDDQCRSEVTHGSLYRVREKREDAWRTVVQVPKKNFIQEVRMETCETEGSSCFTVFPGRAQYQARCVQKYMKWQVLVYNEAKNSTEHIRTILPSCCSCHYKETE